MSVSNLSKKEIKFLKEVQRKGALPLPEELNSLLEEGFVKQIPVPGCRNKYFNKVELTEKYYRWKADKKDAFFNGKLPVVISLIALLKAFQNEILWLLRELAKLLK